MNAKVKSQVRDILVCAVLAAAAFIAHRDVLNCDFVNCDDPLYVSENLRVQQGLSLDNIRWAFKYPFSSWTPLDTLSHMADCQFFGLNPRGHHGTNLAFHVANTVLVFLLLRSLTGSVWRSAFVAALFGVHPINAGAVAWISSRKDVLSTFLGLLTLASYAHYALNPRWHRYALAIFLFCLALMAKPVMVMLPVICLLLDVWPLGRLAPIMQPREADLMGFVPSAFLSRSFAAILVEKIPLFAISAVFALVNFFTQRAAGSVMPSSWYPLWMRVENALVSTIAYLLKMAWPSNLTIIYPHPGAGIPKWEVLGAVLLIALITAASLKTIRSHGYIFTGWLWYLAALFPVSGVVAQLGNSAMADRYAYLSLIGVYMAVVWGVATLAALWAPGGKIAAGVGVVVLVVLALVTHNEQRYWHNSEALWTRALEVTKDNAVAHSSYGEILMGQGKTDEAAGQLEEAIRITPEMYMAQNNLGILLAMRGDMKGAEEKFEEALRIKPDYAKAICNLAKCRLEGDNNAEAKRLFTEALPYIEDYDPMRAVVENAIRELSAMEGKH